MFDVNNCLSEAEELMEMAIMHLEDEFAHIVLDAQDLSPAANGISIAVYDETCSYLIDSMYVDVFAGTGICRNEKTF